MSAMRHRSRAAGYSLIELVAAMTIFAMGVMGAMELFGACLRSTTASVDHTLAVQLCQALMEETAAEGSLMSGADSGDFGENYPRHTWELEIEDTEQDNLMLVRAIVTWDERGREKQYVLTTLVADRY